MLVSLVLSTLGTIPFFDCVGPCAHPDCPCVNIEVCHTEFGTQAILRNPCTGGVRFQGLGTGSTKVLHYGASSLAPCGALTWSDVDECEDICITCA